MTIAVVGESFINNKEYLSSIKGVNSTALVLPYNTKINRGVVISKAYNHIANIDKALPNYCKIIATWYLLKQKIRLPDIINMHEINIIPLQTYEGPIYAPPLFSLLKRMQCIIEVATNNKISKIHVDLFDELRHCNESEFVRFCEKNETVSNFMAWCDLVLSSKNNTYNNKLDIYFWLSESFIKHRLMFTPNNFITKEGIGDIL